MNMNKILFRNNNKMNLELIFKHIIDRRYYAILLYEHNHVLYCVSLVICAMSVNRTMAYFDGSLFFRVNINIVKIKDFD